MQHGSLSPPGSITQAHTLSHAHPVLHSVPKQAVPAVVFFADNLLPSMPALSFGKQFSFTVQEFFLLQMIRSKADMRAAQADVRAFICGRCASVCLKKVSVSFQLSGNKQSFFDLFSFSPSCPVYYEVLSCRPVP